ncbi:MULTISPECIES: ComEA family DNA-binding protein [Shewanella]|uniref:Helix-hairpin-helix DNA-binding motif class 1 domain-containing protein n=1 Tax=Shewanella japonica TaxID=93973 RepID=A0ABM6JJI3_9GAMM|nr:MULTISPECIES: ComEA family DNA-binding protein [Shewanella]ARD21914.1 hypothetical protein SJ2017_1597 [Shewanella japonica]KPZ71740.1 ComE operon protein 1 [Shewanella sp. P1-14-1]MBQ4888289.1 helix-hairpin-helix domain-containing protein [Shewanella sp. MMG014]
MKHSFLVGVVCACALSVMYQSPLHAKQVDSTAKQVAAQHDTVKQTSSKMAKVNINKASAAELQQLKGIGESKAKAIVDYRAKNGKFSNLNQLTQVAGIGDKLVEQNAKQISF